MEQKVKSGIKEWIHPTLVSIIGIMCWYEFQQIKAQLANIPGMITKQEIASIRMDILASEIKRIENDFKDHIRNPAKHETGEVKPQSN